MSVWNVTCSLLVRHLSEGARLDHVLEDVPIQMPPAERRRVRHLVYGVVRHLGLLDSCVARHMHSAPRPLLRVVLLTGAFELLENPAQTPAIVHHAVEQARSIASASEARVVNAVLRKVAASLAEETGFDPFDAAGLARRFSHPQWLVERWVASLGLDDTRRLLEWDQQPAPMHARVARVPGDAAELPSFFKPTAWPAFYLLERADWAEIERMLAAGRIYLQDPATEVAPGLMAAQPGEAMLDLCAAPGGKSLQLAEAVGATGRVVSVDLPGIRLDRLRENISLRRALRINVVAHDVQELGAHDLVACRQPAVYDGVLLDAPCSNTGVLRHRVDAKWRLTPADIVEMPRLQLGMLRKAAAFVRPGGRLVYSTCSLEAEENTGVVQGFLGSTEGVGFTLAETRLSRPWLDGRDGAGAFLLRRGG